MIRGNHDFPPQVLWPLPYDNLRLAALGIMPAAKIRRIFLQLPGGLFEVKIFEMLDSLKICDRFEGFGIQPLLFNPLRQQERLFGRIFNLFQFYVTG